MRPVVAAVLFMSTCQVTQPSSAEYVVAYRLTAESGISCDSVKYENALGDIVKVTAPTLPWSYAYLGSVGTYLQATAWVTATGAGQEVKLKATWTAGGRTAADSSFGSSGGAGKFTLSVARRRL